MTLTRIGDAPPLALPTLADSAPPLAGVRVLDLTRILAGPVGGRTLAAFGADVMLVNSPNLPNIDAIADTSRGKRSAHVDLLTEEGRQALWRLVDGAHVFLQGYRPGSLAARGFAPEALAARRPGIVAISLSAYGPQGPWADRRGFDSLVQTAMGFNHAEGEAAGDGKPRALPMQILDQASGFLIAFGAAAALWRQLARAGLACADWPLAAWAGARARRLAGGQAGLGALAGDAGLGLRPALRGAPGGTAGAHTRRLRAAVGAARHRPAAVVARLPRWRQDRCAAEEAAGADVAE